MSFINYSSREINCKIVYYGPGLCGKTTNLQYIYNKTNPEAKGKMISLATETERTLFFDFLPLSLGEIRGFKTRFHLYTVPGQVFYDASRKLILKGVDGVVYVGDSQMERMEANIESLENLSSNLQEQGYDLNKLPYVVQYNKRDLPNAIPMAELEEALNPTKVPSFEAVAPKSSACSIRSKQSRSSYSPSFEREAETCRPRRRARAFVRTSSPSSSKMAASDSSMSPIRTAATCTASSRSSTRSHAAWMVSAMSLAS